MDDTREEESSAGQYERLRMEEEENVEKKPQESRGERAKVFYYTWWVRLAFLWRILLTFLIPAAIMIAMYVTAFRHAEFMFQVFKLTNYTMRTDMYSALSDALYRYQKISISM